MLSISQKIIQIILSEQGNVPREFLQEVLEISEKEIIESEKEILDLLSPLQLNLLMQQNKYSISLSEEISEILQNSENKELQKPLSDSSLQTLAVILYTNEASKAEIDFIRGVDSSKSLKTLLLKGIIKKEKNSKKTFYTATQETLYYMGLENKENLPDKDLLQEKLNVLFSHE